MANKFVVDLLNTQIENALRTANSLIGVEHHGMRGRLNEIVVEKLIKPLLPPTWEIATGIVCSNNGEISNSQSGQEDILIYDPNFLPPILKEKEQTILPIEAVLAIIEVKSTLTSTGITQAISHSSKIKSKPTTWTIGKGTAKALHQFRYPLYHIYGFRSDLTGENKTEWDRLEELQNKSGSTIPVINSICVADSTAVIQDYRVTDRLKKLPNGEEELRKLRLLLGQSASLKSTDISTVYTQKWLTALVDFTKASHQTRVKKMTTPNLMSYFI